MNQPMTTHHTLEAPEATWRESDLPDHETIRVFQYCSCGYRYEASAPADTRGGVLAIKEAEVVELGLIRKVRGVMNVHLIRSSPLVRPDV